MELNLDISDAAFLGSGSSINKSNEIISTFKVSLSNPKMFKEAYNACKRDTKCNQNVISNFPDKLILQDMYDNELRRSDDPKWKPYTTKEWNEVKRKQAAIKRLSMYPKDSDEWFSLIDRYYKEVLPLVKTRS